MKRKLTTAIRCGLFGLCGIGYSMALGFGGALIGGAGHGTTVLMDFAFLNSSIFENVTFPIERYYWFLQGALFSCRDNKWCNRIFLCLLGIPYLAVAANIPGGRYTGDNYGKMLDHLPVIFPTIICVWLLSQFYLARYAFRAAQLSHGKHQKQPGQESGGGQEG